MATARSDCQPESALQESWRDQLQRLGPLGLPLLAVGAGIKRKAPADPATGRALSSWQTAGHSIEQLRSAHRQVIAAGTRTGADAGGLLAFDIDGATALSWLLEHGCDPEQITTWQIHRDTDPARLKVLFRLSPEQQQQLGQIRTKVSTKAAEKDADGKVIKEGEAVELFHGTGQVIVIGEHPTSGGHYIWPEHLGPEALATIPECWFAAALQVAQPEARSITTSNNSRTRKGEWQELRPCPICSRESGWCVQHEDGRTIRCFQGSTYSPPLGLKPGQEITDRQGTIWAFSREQQQADGHVFSIFVTPDPERRLQRTPAGAIGSSAADDDDHDVLPTYRELLAQALQAIRDCDEDLYMVFRAEIISRFRRTDPQIIAALFDLLTEQETGVRQTSTDWSGSVNLSVAEGLEALIDGAVPANDITLAYGSKGAGKTAAALALSFAVIDGTGFLDHAKATTPGRVLFIASDSGTAPLKTEMQRMGLADHPAVLEGPDKRFHVWAHDANQRRKAWGASITGCVHLLQFIKQNAIDMVVMDSAKAICSKGGPSYTDNDAVTALLTFIKEAICPFTSVVILSHDGTAQGSHSGAKAWAEIPSMVHNIQQIPDRPDERLWRVVKNRMGPLREFNYRIGEDGQLEPVEGVETIQDAGAAVLQVLQEAHARGRGSVSRGDLVAEITRRFRFAPKTIDNTLTRMVGARKPDICRPSRPRGHYKLSPRFLALSPIRLSVEGKEEGKKPVIERDLLSSRGVGTGNSRELSEFPPNSQFPRGGNSADPSQAQRSDPSPSREGETGGADDRGAAAATCRSQLPPERIAEACRLPIGAPIEVYCNVMERWRDGWVLKSRDDTTAHLRKDGGKKQSMGLRSYGISWRLAS